MLAGQNPPRVVAPIEEEEVFIMLCKFDVLLGTNTPQYVTITSSLVT
jgi:hypothetical protein